MPGQPDRPVALRRREVPELLTEELRRLDPDDVYAATVRRLRQMHEPQSGRRHEDRGQEGTAKKARPRSAAERVAGGRAEQ